MSTPQKRTPWISDFESWADAYDSAKAPGVAVATDPPDIADWRREVLSPFSHAEKELRRLGARAAYSEDGPGRKKFTLTIYPSAGELDTWYVAVTLDSSKGITCHVTPRCPVDDLEVFLPTSGICAEQQVTDGRCRLMALAKVLKWADQCMLDELRHHRTPDDED